MEWWFAFRHPMDIWANHPNFLIGELVLYFLGLLTLKHALKSGGRFKYLWLASLLHGVTVESVSYFLPDIDNFWHAQSMVMLLGKRLPFHIVWTYPVFIYTASVAVSKLHLSKLSEPFAVGLAVLLIDIPFDIMGIKLLWWTWHDTDPNVFDRSYWVPFTSYYFHATFCSSFTIIFHNSRRLISHKDKFQSDGLMKEITCCILTGLLSFPLGTLQFIPLYHLLHDNFEISSEICFFLLIGIYMTIAWIGDRQPTKEARIAPNGWIDEIAVIIFVHFSTYIILVFLETPENIRSIGIHETVGDCNATLPVTTAFGQILQKKAFLCVSQYDEGYYDFHCTNTPQDGARWYTVCGTAYKNYVEYSVIVTAMCLLGMIIYIQLLAYSGRQPATALKPIKPVTPKIKAKRN